MSNWCEKHDHFKRDCPWCEIEELEAEIEQLKQSKHWISVKDRLPNQFTNVLIYSDSHKSVFVAHMEPNGKWYGCGGEITVTHWMPLPEPPKGANPSD